ncbi:MFS general substrate transporter [Diplocarpon rosae]|nr:MFS general substrate transporter [Diplocarpon rosae]
MSSVSRIESPAGNNGSVSIELHGFEDGPSPTRPIDLNDPIVVAAAAERATQFERDMPFWEAVKLYRWAIMWVVIFLVPIVGEGYGTVLINSLFAQESFNEKFGVCVDGKCDVPARWKSAMNIAPICGEILGLFISGILVDMEDIWAFKIPIAIQWAFFVFVLPAVYVSPESPWYYARKGSVNAAKAALLRLASGPCLAFNPDDIIALYRHTDDMEKKTSAGSTYLDCFRGVDLRRTEVSKTIVLARMQYNLGSIIVNIVTAYQLTAKPEGWNWGAFTGFFYAGLCALAVVWMYFRLPESRWRGYAELDLLFGKKISARHFAAAKVDLVAETVTLKSNETSP